uniref:Protein transport protein SEC23 n=1 Tax=Salix viminalis TaxID=40686 RepID=A0A6N2MXU6_SALVM
MDWRENALARAAGHQARLEQLFGTCVRHLSSDQALPKHARSPIFSTTLPNLWICPFCFQRNQFPPHYTSISDDNLPPSSSLSIRPSNTRKPQMISPSSPSPMIFMRRRPSSSLPDNSPVGPITFGTLVRVHELGSGEIPKTYIFKGSKDQLLEQMGFVVSVPAPRIGLSSDSISRFLLPASQCEFTLNSVLEELQKDPRPVPFHQRASRCTSTAFSVATCLLGACVPGSGARIMAFIGGPST